MAKKGAYPIILKKSGEGYCVEIPDFGCGTQGSSIVDAIEMARDCIGMMGIDMEDDGEDIPEPYSTKFEIDSDDVVTLVDVDFGEYRRKADNRAVKKNCTIPYWMSLKADELGLNYSRVLQDAISNIINSK